MSSIRLLKSWRRPFNRLSPKTRLKRAAWPWTRVRFEKPSTTLCPRWRGQTTSTQLHVNYAHQRPPRGHLRRKNEKKTNNEALRTVPFRAEPALKFFYHDPMERPRIPKTLNQPKLTASIGRSRVRHSSAVSA